MKDVFAYSFRTGLSLAEIFARLNATGPWRWSVRDSEQWGEYISTRALPDYAMAKIFVEDDSFVVNVTFESDRPAADAELDALRAVLLTQVLPSIEARDVSPTDTYD